MIEHIGALRIGERSARARLGNSGERSKSFLTKVQTP
jgi:hypothetical protein